MSADEVQKSSSKESVGAAVSGQMDTQKRIIYKVVLTGGMILSWRTSQLVSNTNSSIFWGFSVVKVDYYNHQWNYLRRVVIGTS